MHIPKRMCIACRTMKAKDELIKIVRTENGAEIDEKKNKFGRGAYVCKNEECIKLMVKRRSLAKHFKKQVDNTIYEELVKEADYCGIYTGKKVDKFEKCKLTKVKGTQIDAPMIDECPVSIECKVTDIIHLGSHDMFMADIVAVNVDESLFDKDDKMHLDKANLIAYAHGEYFELGKKIGQFGFSTNKKKKNN